jgi:hypothetical protein
LGQLENRELLQYYIYQVDSNNLNLACCHPIVSLMNINHLLDMSKISLIS